MQVRIVFLASVSLQMNSVRESPGMKEVWTSLVHVWVSSTNGNIHSFSLLGTFQQFLDVVPQRLFLLWNCYENIKPSQNNNSMKCSWGDEREPKPPMTPGWAGAWLCSSGTCRCSLPGRCVCRCSVGFGHIWEPLQGSSVKERDAGTAHLTLSSKNG